MRYAYATFALCLYPTFCLCLLVWLLCGGALEIADWFLPDKESK